MPRSDSSGSSRNRRGPSRSSSSRKSFDDKGPSRGKKSDRPRPDSKSGFKKSDSGKPTFRKREDSQSFPPRKRSSSDSRGGKFNRTGPGEARPSRFKKSDSEKPSFRSKGSSLTGDKKFNRNKGDEKRPSGFRKFSSEKPSFKRREDSSENKRSFSGDKKPFARKFDERTNSDRPEKTPFRKENRERSNPSFSGRSKEKPSSVSPAIGKNEPSVQSEKIRLNKFIANSGVCSRREADELIKMGLISVNGKTITELGYKVNPSDEVRHESKVLRSEKNVYILLNKPKGYITTTNDPQERNTVMHIIGNAVKERIYPVGRLDRNTTGLLLLTNDGDLADKLMHPSYNSKKIYKAELDRPFAKADLDKIIEGVHLEEGRAMVDDVAIVSDDRKTVGLEIHIGWNRVVRRIFEALDYQVVKLDRSVYAGLDKKDLPRGHWRPLTKEEIIRLKHYNKAGSKA